MVGRDIKDIYPPRNNDKKTIGKTILEAENFSCHDCFTDVSFELREGEILGIAGLQGCGRTELAECLIGARQGSGELQVFGEKFAPRYTAQSIERGLVYIPPDRRWDSIIPDQSIAFNMAISSLKKFNRSGIISEKQIKETAHKQVETLQIKTPSVEQLILKLSGGNQQKVVFSRALVAEPKILILNEPTRGIDVGAKYEIYVLIQELAAEGMGIIFISSELPELMAICDRIMVMWEGKKAGEFDPEQHSKESVLDAMMGGKAQIAV